MFDRRVVTRLLLASVLVPAVATVAAAQAPRSPRNASYRIDVSLDPRTHALNARETITWRNITSRPTGELQFHLYWNAWTDRQSTWMRERIRTGEIHREQADFAELTIKGISYDDVPAGTPPSDLSGTIRYLAPDDGNTDDRTVMAVSLPRPVQPGETVHVSVDWTARVPRTFERTGAIGRYYFVAQWFPKLGVLEDSGWNCHQFHAQTEFFSDYGVYDVTIRVPKGWVVGATGVERDTADGGQIVAHHFVQEDVHDFAWTASPDFVVRTARFDEPGLPPVDMRLLMQPEHVEQAERHFAATRSTLRRYGNWFGPYPYGHLTIVDPAWQSDSGGMEYPTLITAGTQWLVSRSVTLSTPEEVVMHEAGHQFWYGMVGSNEFEHAWMDEGINTYATARAMAADYPDAFLDRYYFGGFIPWTFRDVRYSRETDLNRLWDYRRGASEDAIGALSYRQRPETVRFFAYDKPAVWLNTLERWLGWPSVQKALSDSFQKGAYGHPEPAVVLSALQASTERDLSRFLDQTYRQAALFDYSVADIAASPRSGQQQSRVLVRRLGDGVFPVDVRVVFENGDEVIEHWNGESRWREFTYLRPSAVRSAVIDPERTLLLDMNFTNNSRTRTPRAREAASKWTLKWIVWLQDAVLTWGLLA